MFGGERAGRAGSGAVVVERCRGRRLPTAFAGIVRRPEANPFLGYETMDVTLRRHTLRRVVLDRGTGVLIREGRFGRRPAVLTETAYLQPPERVAALRIQDDAAPPVPGRTPVTLCFDHWDTNYYHWLAHTLPVLGIFAGSGNRDAPLLLPDALTAWQSETLELLGLATAGRPRIAAGAQRRLRVASYYDHVRGLADFAVSERSRATYERIVRAVDASDPATGRRIYVSRRDSSKRRAPNEADLEAALAALGFDCVLASTLTLREQVRRFRGATFVMGFHGAGLSNIAWCAPGTVVYELVPGHYVNPCFAVMAHQGALRYWADLIESGGEHDGHEARFAQPVDVGAIVGRAMELAALT